MTATGGSGSQDALASPPMVPPATADQASSEAERQRQLFQTRTAEHFTFHTANSATITDSNGHSALYLRTVSIAAARSEVRLRSPTGRAIVAAAVLGSALAYMSDDMLNVAIPSVAADLGGTVGDIQWVVNAYYVTLVALVLVAGAVGDIVGHRRVFVAGMALFTVGALACAVAPLVWVLIVGRGVQGIGAAMTLAAGLALVSRLIQPADRAPAAVPAAARPPARVGHGGARPTAAREAANWCQTSPARMWRESVPGVWSRSWRSRRVGPRGTTFMVAWSDGVGHILSAAFRGAGGAAVVVDARRPAVCVGAPVPELAEHFDHVHVSAVNCDERGD